jgi:hypothetical protein
MLKKEEKWLMEFQTCSNACSNGMAFGDVNDKESEITKLADDEENVSFVRACWNKTKCDLSR